MNKIIFFIFILFSVFKTYAEEEKGAQFKGKYLFTDSHNPKLKEYNEVVSKCFKLNEASLKELQSYDSCYKSKDKEAPLDKVIGECHRKKDKASVYFFNSKEDCAYAQQETQDGANS